VAAATAVTAAGARMNPFDDLSDDGGVAASAASANPFDDDVPLSSSLNERAQVDASPASAEPPVMVESRAGGTADDDDDDDATFYSQSLCIIPDVHAFSLPPKTSARAWSAEAMREKEIWAGVLKVVTRSEDKAVIQLVSADGRLFAAAPVSRGRAFTECVESASDSSRYFSIVVRNDQGRSAPIGIGFRDRTGAFDFRASLMEWEKKRTGVAAAQAAAAASEDLSLRAGTALNLAFHKEPSTAPAAAPASGPLAPPPAARRRGGAERVGMPDEQC